MNHPFIENLSKGLENGLRKFLKDHPEFILKQQENKELPPQIYNTIYDFSLHFSSIRNLRNKEGYYKNYIFWCFEDKLLLTIDQDGDYVFIEEYMNIVDGDKDLSDSDSMSHSDQPEIFSKEQSIDCNLTKDSE